MDHRRAPLFEAMRQHQRRMSGNFHIPGHKQGQAFDPAGKDYFSSLLQLDFTEVEGLDDLHAATGVIAEAQALAADAFGADDTFFLVGGTTAGNLATLLAICQPGDPVIIQRSSHQSIFHGCMLAGVRPIYVGAEIDCQTGFEKPLPPERIQQILQSNPKVKGVWITSPSYFGINQDIEAIASICHHYNVPLIVDEAHGAHYTFHEQLPPSAMAAGADIAIQSTHKMLTSMTMSSMLHVKEGRVERESLTKWLRVIESSSPSYPLMASLDLARRYMVMHGRTQLDRVWQHLSQLRQALHQCSGLEELILQKDQDPFKLSLRLSGRTGFFLSSLLRKSGLYPELENERLVLFVFSVGSTQTECDQLLLRLQQIASETEAEQQETKPFFTQMIKPISEALFSFEELRRSQPQKVPLEEAVGLVSAEMIIPYPPGIPVLLPGEVFTAELVEQLIDFLNLGGNVRGIELGDPKLVNVLR